MRLGSVARPAALRALSWFRAHPTVQWLLAILLLALSAWGVQSGYLTSPPGTGTRYVPRELP